MASQIDNLRAGGFSDAEISEWATEKRKILLDGGFKDNEVDAYFSGGPVVPEGIPKPLLERFSMEELTQEFMDGYNQTLTGQQDSAKRILEETAKGWSAGVGKEPYGFSAKSEKFLSDSGVFRNPENPGLTDGLRLMNEAWMRPVAGAGDAILRSLKGVTHAVGGVVGQTLEETGAASHSTAQKAKRDVALLGDIALLLAGAHTPMARVERGPTGELYKQPIGNLPKSDDFVAAAKNIAGDEGPPVVQDKLLKLYTEQGRHPAEVAHDAATDPIVKQHLLSSDAADMPYITAYHGSPHNFEKFDLLKIGTGEGAQAYGHGLYFAERPEVARSYQALADAKVNGRPYDLNNPVHLAANLIHEKGSLEAALAEARARMQHDPADFYGDVVRNLEGGKTPKLESQGSLYEVKIKAPPEQFLDWDKPLSEQSPQVISAIEAVARKNGNTDLVELRSGNLTGQDFYDHLAVFKPDFEAGDTIQSAGERGRALASRLLNEAGIPGLRYLDHGSRGAGEGSRNLVLFDDKLVEITKKNGEPATAAERQQYLDDAIGGQGGKPPAPPKTPEGTPPSGGEPTPQQKILDKISVGEGDPTRKITWDKVYTETVDNLHPFKGVSDDAYQLARLSRGQFAKAQQFLEHGTFDFKTYKNNGKPLKEILAPVRDDLDGWRAYAAAKRAIDLEAEGKKSGMDLDAAKQVVADGADKFEGITKEVLAYQDRALNYLKESGVVSESAVAAMREANKNYVPFYRMMGEGPEGRGTGKSFGPGSPIKKIKGSERDIVDPLESIIKNTYAYISVAERNAVGIKLVDALKKAGSEVVTTKLPTKDAELSAYLAEQGIKNGDDLAAFVRGIAEDGETISAYRNGVKETVKVDDPELVRAFRGLDTQNMDMLTKILAVPARTLRAGAVLNPDFMARNLINDFIAAFVNTKGAIFTPINTAKGLVGVVRKDADFQNWLKSGGGNATLVSLDRRYLQESLEKLTAETGLGTRAWNVVTSPLKGLRMLSELTENATRLGEFKKIVEGAATKEQIQAAGFSSREVTLDFARVGASMRAYNAITAFANAQIQGTDRLVRSFKDNPTRTTARIAAGITVPSMLLWWANHDDPRYKEIPTWQKDLYWIILTDKWEPVNASQAAMRQEHSRRLVGDQWYVNNGHTWRIPKGHTIGVLFGAGAERVLDATIGNNPEAFAHFGKSLMASVLPNFVPTISAPMVDQFANRSTFTDRTLIPTSMEKFLPEYQYTEYTTETSKALGRLIASFPGVREASISDDSGVAGSVARAATSPILIENYLRAWTGGLGMYALNVVDFGLRKTGVLPDPPKPEDTLADIPFVKAFAIRYPSAGAQSIQDFYDGNERSKKYFDTWMAKAKEGDVSAMASIQAAGGPSMFARLDGLTKVLGEHSKLVRDIYKDQTTPPAEKRQLIDQVYYSMISIGQAGRQMQRQIDAAASAGRN